VDRSAALVAGGLSVIEITLRTAAGLDALRGSRGLGAIVGAGTVTTSVEAAQVIDAGAQFAVSPGIAPDMVSTLLAADEASPVIHERLEAGDHIVGHFRGDHSLRPALVLCHFVADNCSQTTSHGTYQIQNNGLHQKTERVLLYFKTYGFSHT
jgi:hypothetical protein